MSGVARSWVVLLACTLAFSAHASPAISDVLEVKRPPHGEYLGLYLLDKKVGYLLTDLKRAEPGQARSIQEAFFKMSVGGREAERFHRETRTYESKPRGRLLSFRFEQRGDGGEQVLQGVATPSGFAVTRKRPNQPDEKLSLPPCGERVEDADQARVALKHGAKVEGTVLDAEDLGCYRVHTEVKPPLERLIGGVKARLSHLVTLSEKERVPVDGYFSERGELLEVDFGETMKGRAEPESVAKRLDRTEVFGLTRIVLPAPLPASARSIPGVLTLTVSGLSQPHWKSGDRQHFKSLGGGKVEVHLEAKAPTVHSSLPLADPSGGTNLKSTIVVESDNPEIRRTAKQIVGDEKDAYAATQKIVSWVGKNMAKQYGASSDRATDVLRQMRGDCTEHSLLSVALLRAEGIPARRVDGIVYLPQEDGVPAFYWHEWVEAYVGQWTQLDPTLGQPVADATHFQLGEEGNAEIVPLIGQLKVLASR